MANHPTNGPNIEERLRTEANERLKEGNTPDSRGWTISADALSLLYRLASDADSAGDALKLLHELQAHQVELDLQYEHIKANERELAQDLGHYRTLFEFAPVGYFIVDFDGQVIETNRIGAEWLGMDARIAQGKRLGSFLDTASRATLIEFLGALRESGSNAVCHVHAGHRGDSSRILRITADVAPGGDAVLLIMSEAE